MSLPERGQVLNVGVRQDVRRKHAPQPKMAMLPHPSQSKRKQAVGFVGGIDALRSKANQQAVSDPDAKMGINPIRVIKPKSSHVNVTNIGRVVYIKSNISLCPQSNIKNIEIDDAEESDIEESREGEDMEVFCKRMCKRTRELQGKHIKIVEVKEDVQKISAREKLKKNILNNFRTRVKDATQFGKLKLYQYGIDTKEQSFLVSDLLKTPINNSLLKQLSNEVHPFRLWHYQSNKSKQGESPVYIIEITWTSASMRNPKGPANLIMPKKPALLDIADVPKQLDIWDEKVPLLVATESTSISKSLIKMGKAAGPPPPVGLFNTDELYEKKSKKSKKNK